MATCKWCEAGLTRHQIEGITCHAIPGMPGALSMEACLNQSATYEITCEGCSIVMKSGDPCYHCDDGPVLCEACVPTWGDAEQQWLQDSDAAEADRKATFMAALEAYLANGGQRSDKLPCFPL